MFEVPPLCENESDDAPNGSYDLISSFGTYTNQKPHRVSLKKLGWINGVNPLPWAKYKWQVYRNVHIRSRSSYGRPRPVLAGPRGLGRRV